MAEFELKALITGVDRLSPALSKMQKKIRGFKRQAEEASQGGLALGGGLAAGLTLSSIFIVYTAASIASTFVVTAGMFGAMSLYGYTTKRDLSGFGNMLFMALIGIVLASLVNFWLKSEALMWAVTYIGVIVFVGLTAYDTQKLKNMGEQIDTRDTSNLRKYSILGALTLYLDFINLFLMLLRIFGNRR